MNTKQLLLICFTFFIASLFSCQKDFIAPDNVSRTDSTIVVGGDSNYLDKIVFIDGISSSGPDTGVFVFNYDSQKRLKNVVIKAYLVNPLDSQFYVKFSYNLNDTLPFKAHFYTDSSDYYFFYDNLGRLVKDSIFSSDNSNIKQETQKYTYNTNKIFIKRNWTYNYLPLPLQVVNGNDTLILDAVGNVVSGRYYTDSLGISTFQRSLIATYDTKIIPYKNTLSFKIFLFSFNDYYDGLGYFSTNNPISSNLYSPSGGFASSNNFNFIENYSNAYYPNGFLKKSIITGDNNENWTYFYKSL